MVTSTIFQGYDQNILNEATISASVSPMATYDLATLGFNRPDFRVRFSTGTVTITFTLAGGSPAPAALGDILVIPMSNLVNGCVALTNDAGLNVNIPVPASLRNGIPKTIVVDLSLLETNATVRTSGVWHLVITGNTDDVTLGGAIAIYSPKTRLTDRDFQWAYTTRKAGAVSQVQNEYLTRFRLNLEAMERSIDLQTLATDTDADALEAWFDANNGEGKPGLLWLTPEVEDAFFGVWQQTFERIVGSAQVPDTNVISLKFTELSKGIPLL